MHSHKVTMYPEARCSLLINYIKIYNMITVEQYR